jgi:hypothetical protein
MSEVNDYLKYYLGTEVQCEVGNPDAVIVSAEMAWLHQGRHKYIKPILRSLDDMTEEEARECGNLIYDFSNEPELVSKNGSAFEYHLMPEEFHWLLSRGFDLFGLIDTGLAIEHPSLTSKTD